jgi:hypothetical protein
MLPLSIAPVQDQVLAALANGASLADAAAEAQVHRNTIGNWRRSSAEFRSAFANALYDRALLIREQAESLASLAIDTIGEILADPRATPSIRLKAALAILHQATTLPPEPPAPEPPAEDPPAPEIVHNDAQSIPTSHSQTQPRVGRNQPCPCGSGSKFKACCLNKPAKTPQPAVTIAS